MLPGPYLLYIGDAPDELAIKSSRGMAHWRPEACVGQHRAPASTLTLGLPDMSFQQAKNAGASTLVLGVANAGGVMAPALVTDVLAALEAGLNIASGLHQRLSSVPAIAQTAQRLGAALFDAREPSQPMPIGKGFPRAGRRLLTVGTDCSVGKMYTSLALERELRGRGVAADFRATGQTGIFIAKSGVPIDAVVADFISGAAEWISPAREDGGWDLIEGQGSLFHPSFAGVSLGLLHGSQPDALVLCHEPNREHMRGVAGRALPDLATCLAANLESARLTNTDVQAVGVSLNTSKLSSDAARALCDKISAELNLPCQDPVALGVDQIVDKMLACFAS